MEKINFLKEKLNEIKQLIESPQLYLSDFYDNLKTVVDLAFVQKEISVNDNQVRTDLKNNWLELIQKIETLEKDFTKDSSFKRKYTTNDELDIMKSRINYIESNLDSDRVDFWIEYAEEQLATLEKTLFKNQTLTFIQPTKSVEALFKKMNKNTTCGKLIIISNGYFSKNSIQILLKNEKTLIRKSLSNETIRIDKLRKQLFENITQNQIDTFVLDFENVDLSVLNLKCLPDDLFKNFSNLTTIVLSQNKLTEINKCLFKDLFSLKAIDLSYNKLNRIPQDAFANLSSLIRLNLSFNDLEDLDSNLFKDLINLKELALVRNQLKKLDENVFTEVKSLERINLSYNKLEYISSKCFTNSNKLVKIDLSFNRINLDKMDKRMFERLDCLEWINLSNNDFKRDKLSLETPANLKFVSFKNGLCGNNIESIITVQKNFLNEMF